MQIRVDKDNLRIIKLSQLESGEVDVTEVNFIFTPEYKDLIKTAVFTLGDKSYKVILQNDKCYVPLEVLVEGNKITIGVYAFKSEGEELILRYSPVPVTAEILKGSYVEEAENTSHPTPTEIEQLLELILTNKNSIDDLSDRVDTLEEDKDKCYRDIDSIKDDLIDIKSDIQDLEDDVTSIRSDINNINENIEDIESEIQDINSDISNINTSITNIERVDERQNRRLNDIDNFIRQWPKTEYQTGTNINLGKTLKAVVEYEDDKVLYGNAEQEGTPTPTEPIPISVVTGTQEVVVRGKNLLKFSSARQFIMNIKKGETFSISLMGTTSSSNKSIYLRTYSGEYSSNLDSYTEQITLSLNGTRQEGKITSSIDGILYLRSGGSESAVSMEYIQVEEGSTATSYEPYITPTTYQIHLGNLELAKIGTYQDYIYFDDEGKWYKKAYFGRRTLNGTENWTYYTASSTNHIIYTDFPNLSYSGSGTNTNFLMENFKSISQGCFFTNVGRLHFYVDTLGYYSLFPDKTSWTTYLSNNNQHILYQLGSATDEEITDTTLIADLDNLYAMMSVNGTTIIEVSGNLPAIIKVRAYAQLQAAT